MQPASASCSFVTQTSKAMPGPLCRWVIAILFLTIVFLCLAILAILEHAQGVTVSIHNAGTREMRDIKVYVTGVCYGGVAQTLL